MKFKLSILQNFITFYIVWFVQTRIKKMLFYKSKELFKISTYHNKFCWKSTRKRPTFSTSLEVFSLFTFVAAVLVGDVGYDVCRVLFELRVLLVRAVVRSLLEKNSGTFVCVVTLVEIVSQTQNDIKRRRIVAVTSRISVLRLLVESTPFGLGSCNVTNQIDIRSFYFNVNFGTFDLYGRSAAGTFIYTNCPNLYSV